MKSSVTVGTGTAVEQAMNGNINLPLAGGVQEQTHLWGLGMVKWTLCGGMREWVYGVGIVIQASDGKIEVR